MVFPVTWLLLLAALHPVQSATTKCTKLQAGYLSTDTFNTPEEPEYGIRRTFTFNSRKEVAYYKTGTQPKIYAEFQTCTPNYAREAQSEDRYFGRFYLPKEKKCLAVSNPSGNPPYYITQKDCLAPKDMATSASIPFNFIGFQGDDINFQWYGATIPSKNIYQGSGSSAKNCRGAYFVNATSPLYGHKYPGRGEPNTSSVSSEMNRVRLYCPKAVKYEQFTTSFNTFILV